MTQTNRSTLTQINGAALSIPQLRAEFRGQVIAPQDEGFDAARTIFYGGFDRHPAVIIRAADATDVARAVRLAHETGLELAIRSGGHSVAGHGVSEGGIVLDLKNMKGLEIDAQNHTAWAEAGLTAGEYTAEVGKYGLATGFGDTGTVGIGGITLGGGVGFLLRKHGMTIDNLLAAEIVTANGQLLHVDAKNHPDLFWAIRGGGGNFGVVTRFQFRLHEVSTVIGGMLFLPATADVIAAVMAEAEAAPEELSMIANIMPAPPMPFLPPEAHGKLVLMVMMVYAGPVEEGQRAIAPFRAIAKPIADTLRPMRYPEMFPAEEGNGYHPTAVSTTMFVDQITSTEGKKILDYLQSSNAVMRVTQLRVLGGAMARVPADATAFAHRQSRIMVNLAAFYTSPEDKLVREAWVAEFASALRQQDSGGYVNFMGTEGGARIHEAYPDATWERLTEIKARYDPTNLFRLNQNIPPKGV